MTEHLELHEQYAELMRRKRNLQAEIRDLNEQLSEVESRLLSWMDQNALQKVRTRGGATISRMRDLTIAAVNDSDELSAAIKRAKLGWMLTANRSKLKAWIKERCRDEATGDWEPDVRQLPPSLQKEIKLGVRETLGVTFS